MDTIPRTGNFVNLQGLIRHVGNVKRRMTRGMLKGR
jgi:hypothetical protein